MPNAPIIQSVIYRGYDIIRRDDPDKRNTRWYIRDGVNELRFESLEKAQEMVDHWHKHGRPDQAGR